MSAFLVGLVLGQLVGAVPPKPGTNPITLTITDRTEGRVRSSIRTVGPRFGQGSTAIDFDNLLTGILNFPGGHHSYQIGYAPRFSYLDITGDRSVALMHSGRAGGSFWGRRYRLSLALDGSIGSQSAIAALTPVNLAPTTPVSPNPATVGQGTAPTTPTVPTPPPQQPPAQTPIYIPLTALTVINVAAGRATFGGSYLFSRRIAGTANVFFGATGGLDWQSQRVTPPSHGPGGDVGVIYTLNARDSFVSSVSTSYTTVLATPQPGVVTGPDRDYIILTALEGYRHAWSRRTTSTVSAGVTYLGSTNDPTGTGDGISVAGDASIAHVEPLGRTTRVEYRGAVQFGTVFNPVLGTAQKQASALASYSWTHEPISLVASGGAATTFPWDAVDAARTVYGALTAGYAPAPSVQLQTGVRLYAELFPPTLPEVEGAVAPLRTPPQWTVFLAVTLYAPVIAF